MNIIGDGIYGKVTPSILITALPEQDGIITYNGKIQYPLWKNYSPNKFTIGGDISGIDAGEYTATFSCNKGFKLFNNKKIIDAIWKINKLQPSLSLSASTITMFTNDTTDTFTVNKTGDGVVTVMSSNNNIATATISNNIVTVTKISSGSADIIVRVSESNNCLPAESICKVTCNVNIPTNYLTFSSPTSFALKTNNRSKNWDGKLYYSSDNRKWKEWDGIISLNSGSDNKLYLAGSGNSKITGKDENENSYKSIYRWVLAGDNIACDGNIENLLDWEIVKQGNHPTMSDSCYRLLF